MQVILQETIEQVGKAGEVITVADGYARNYLLPQKKAVVADPKNLKMLEHQQRVVALQEAKRKTEAETFARSLEAVKIVIAREAGEVPVVEEAGVKGEGEKVEERLFGSVTSQDIAEALRHEHFTIDRRQIKLSDPIRKPGQFEIPVRLHAEVTAMVKVNVVKK